jgi:ABC-type transport system involved in multi-copper enzyme maturation permease subunit
MSSLGRIRLVAWHVFKESVRDRVLYAIGGFAVLLVIAAVLIAQITAGQDVKIIKDLGLAVVELAGMLMSIVIGVGLIAREIERRSIFALLSKPLARWEFVLGKFAGLVMTIVVNMAGMTLALYLMLAYAHTQMTPAHRLAMEAPVVDPRLLLAMFMIALELALLTAVALFFSTFSSSTLLSISFTIGLLLAGLFSPDLRQFGSLMDVSPVVAGLVEAVGWAVPSFAAFDIKTQVVHGLPVPAGYIVWTSVYALLYLATLLTGSMVLFSRREFV